MKKFTYEITDKNGFSGEMSVTCNGKKERIRTFIIDYDSAEKFAEFLYSIKARFEYCEMLLFVNFQVLIENDEQQVIVDNWVKNHYKRDDE